jgi:phosphomannomutase
VVATLRTSGTEPKLKYYCELGGGDASKPEAVRAELARTVEAIISEMLQPELHGLKR